MANFDWITLAAIALGGFGVINALPSFMAVVNPRSIRCWFGDALEKDEVVSRSEAVRQRLQDLEGLSFSLLGVKHEKLPLWGRQVREMATASQEAAAFASIVLTGKGDPFIVYFYTPFQDGGLVYTRQKSSLSQVESDRISVKNIPSDNLAELFHSHRERVAAFRQKGLVPLPVDHGQEARIEATYWFYDNKYAKKVLALSALTPFLTFLLVAYLLWLGGRGGSY